MKEKGGVNPPFKVLSIYLKELFLPLDLIWIVNYEFSFFRLRNLSNRYIATAKIIA